jgi:HK97 gp10 family phage protein
MPVKSRLTTKGFEAYLEELARAGKAIDPITDTALLAGGEILVDGMHRRVAKDTENLDQHLGVEGPFQEGNFHYVEVGLRRDTDADTARYGNVNEFGSAKMAAQPFVRPALDEDLGKARAAMRDVFEQEGAL